MKLGEFVSADPYMSPGGWRRELVAGEPRTLDPPGPETAARTMLLASELVAMVKRAHLDLRIEMGGGIGVAEEEGDQYRVADIILSQEEKPRRRNPLVVCLLSPDPANPTADESDRIGVICRHKTVRDVLVFAVGAPAVRAYRKSGGEWSHDDANGAEERIRLSKIKGSIFLSAIYPGSAQAAG